MAQRTSDRFTRGTSRRSGNNKNEPTGDDDPGVAGDNQYSGQRRPCLGGGEHTHRTFKGIATRANSDAAPAVRNVHPMVVRVVFILVEPTGHNAPVGSRAARKGGNNCCDRTREPFRKRFSRTVHRLQAWYRMIRQVIVVRASPLALEKYHDVRNT